MFREIMFVFIGVLLVTSPIIIFGLTLDRSVPFLEKQKKLCFFYFLTGVAIILFLVKFPSWHETVEDLTYMKVWDVLDDDYENIYRLHVWTPAGHYEYLDVPKSHSAWGAPENAVYKVKDVAKHDIPVLTPLWNWIHEENIHYYVELSSTQWISTEYKED